MIWTTELLDSYLNDKEAFLRDGKLSYLLDGKKQGKFVDPFFRGMPGFKAPNLQFKITDEECLAFERCIEDPIFFSNITKSKGFIHTGGFSGILRDYQVDIINNLHQHRFNIFTVSRQIGMTTCACLDLVHYLIVNHGKTIVVLSPNQSSSDSFGSLISDLYMSLPFYLKPGVIAYNKKSIIFENGNKIIYCSTVKSIKAFSVDYLILPDFAFHREGEKIIQNYILTTPLLNNSKINVYSVPGRDGDSFSKLALLQNKLLNKKEYTWNVVKSRDGNWADTMIKVIGEADFLREYECCFPGTPVYERHLKLDKILDDKQ